VVWQAWGLLNAFNYRMVVGSFEKRENQVFQLASLLTGSGWVIAVAWFSYYQERTTNQAVKKTEVEECPASLGFTVC
jgi:hypothetical protein